MMNMREQYERLDREICRNLSIMKGILVSQGVLAGLILVFGLCGCTTLPLEISAPLDAIKDVSARAQCATCVEKLNGHRQTAAQQSTASAALVIAGGSVAAAGGVLGVVFESTIEDKRATITAAVVAATSGLISLISTLIQWQEDGKDYVTQGQQDKIEEIESELQDMEWM